jgi:AraC family transcriptional regulator, transcriptional activator of pobA
MYLKGPTDDYFELRVLDNNDCEVIKESIESSLSILWFQDDQSELKIDGKSKRFYKNEILFLTEFHKIEIDRTGVIQFIRFNRSFFCIIDHDSEIGCKGVLFFGSSNIPIIKIPKSDLRKFESFWKMFLLESEEEDSFQIEMIRTMLKRYVILCTRIYKDQNNLIHEEESSLIREFNFLVEQHFRDKHRVSDYASLLNRSPKTLSNIFQKHSSKSPLQFIQNRKILESKRLLGYSDLQVQEIGHQIGYDDIQSFSRFFKRQTGQSPVSYRMNVSGKKDNN